VSPQESGSYFVLSDVFFARILNDVFRFITEINHVVIQENENCQNAKSASKTVLSRISMKKKSCLWTSGFA
jgi:hypothetical protein